MFRIEILEDEVMKNTVIWTLAFLLGFEPALMAQGQARQNADIKAFIEMSGISKRPVTFRELYNKFSAYLPQAQKEELKGFIQTYGDMQIPKMDITKINGGSGAGDEIYKLQVVQKGQAGSIEIFNDGKQFARVNGQVLTADDMKSTQTVMEKVGIPKQAAATFKRPVRVGPDLLSGSDILKLKKADQKAYMKQFRAILASMEAVQTVDLQTKTTALERSSGKFDVIARWLRGQDALAMKEGDKCVVAGNVTEVGIKDKRLTCGVDAQGMVFDSLRRKSDGETCGEKQFACGLEVYGPTGGNFCVPIGKDSTLKCNEYMDKHPEADILAEAAKAPNSASKFRELMASAKAAAEDVRKTCQGITAESAATPARSAKNTKNRAKGLIDDQIQTCAEFDKRWETLSKWDCEKNADFKKNYEKLCKEKAEAGGGNVGVTDDGKPKPEAGNPAAGTGTPPPPPGSTTGAPGEIVACDNLPMQYSLDNPGSSCAYGRTKNKDFTCKDSAGKPLENHKIYECFCKDKDGKDVAPVDRYKCTATAASADAAAGGGKSWFKRNSKWLIPLAFGFVGLLVFHWLNKKAAKQNYEYLEPVTPLPPVAPPVAPVPRGTN